MLVLAAGGLSAGERYAFLAAVRQYDRNELNDLQYTENDATALAAVLKESGYNEKNIVLMTQALGAQEARFAPFARNILKELRLLLEELTAEDTVLVAFSGHGIQFKGEGGPYFCPADARLADRETLVSIDAIYQALEECPAGTKVLLVDACRNDPQSKLAKAARAVELEPAGISQQSAPARGMAAFFSCTEGQQSYEDPELEHGVFLHYVIEGLRGEADLDEDDEITLAELEQYTGKAVQGHVRRVMGQSQRPVRKGEANLVAIATVDRAASALVVPRPRTPAGRAPARPPVPDYPPLPTVVLQQMLDRLLDRYEAEPAPGDNSIHAALCLAGGMTAPDATHLSRLARALESNNVRLVAISSNLDQLGAEERDQHEIIKALVEERTGLEIETDFRTVLERADIDVAIFLGGVNGKGFLEARPAADASASERLDEAITWACAASKHVLVTLNPHQKRMWTPSPGVIRTVEEKHCVVWVAGTEEEHGAFFGCVRTGEVGAGDIRNREE
jgi:hypothetical protein